jgi:UDP-glucose 4-epimerase
VVVNWLITGGCGFIGSSLIKALVANEPDVNIRVLDDLSVGSKEDLAEVSGYREVTLQQLDTGPIGVELLIGDICEEHTCLIASIGVDVIVHLAANTGVGPSVEDPRSDCVTNVIGIFNMLESARRKQVKRFIFASSGAPVGECAPPIHEELAPHPVSPYGASKLAGEGYCSAYYRSFGVETVCLRFGNVYGPRSKNKASVIAKFIKQAIAGESLEIYGDGEQTRDFIYIGDLLRAIQSAVVQTKVGGEIFQIASNQEVSIDEVLNILIDILKGAGVSEVDVKKVNIRVGDVRRNFSDISKARKRLGWQPKVTLEEGVRQTVSYFTNKI